MGTNWIIVIVVMSLAFVGMVLWFIQFRKRFKYLEKRAREIDKQWPNEDRDEAISVKTELRNSTTNYSRIVLCLWIGFVALCLIVLSVVLCTISVDRQIDEILYKQAYYETVIPANDQEAAILLEAKMDLDSEVYFLQYRAAVWDDWFFHTDRILQLTTIFGG